MRKRISLSIVLYTSAFAIMAQNDTMYFMKSGYIVGKFDIYTQVDSIIFYHPQPPTKSTFADLRDGKVYQTVTIGDQVWMAENLAYLPSVVNSSEFSRTISYYYVYGYEGTSVEDAKATENYKTYGVLYNWTAAMAGSKSSSDNPSGVRGVCPAGWHLPSDAEWTQLIDLLGGPVFAGGKMKETGTTHWDSPNTQATNEVGFTALPGGADVNRFINSYGSWWSSTGYSSDRAWNRYLGHNYNYVVRHTPYRSSGGSIRCVKD